MHKVITLLICIAFFGCIIEAKPSEDPLQIAFLSDVHLQDIYGEFSDNDYKGILNPETGKYTLARTMQSQLQSTRIFNENYFAFLAALDDIAKRGVKIAVFPGDFSDDGQAVNIRGLKRILDHYSSKHNIQFILTTGNHDPVRPFRMPAGKADFLGPNGQSQAIFSHEGMYSSVTNNALPTIITKDIAKLGYKEILLELGDFGFFPKATDLYWESPFSSYSYENYSFKDAEKQSVLKNRYYKSDEASPEIPDVSYLVEPIKNIWFLAIDANVYIPKDEANEAPQEGNSYNGASIGYNNLLTHKSHLSKWIKSVTERAEQQGKTLVVFSHYPTLDFYDGAVPEIAALFGAKKMQLHRVPNKNVSNMLIEAGVKVHFGGHMHMNDTGVRHLDSGSLVNVQIPSLAAYVPGYKLLTLREADVFEIETVIIDTVPGFKSLFPLYLAEHAYLEKMKSISTWDKQILKAETYKAFTTWHLNELVRLRFLKEDWPQGFKETMTTLNGGELLSLCFNDIKELDAFQKNAIRENEGMESFHTWSGLEMINDFYKIRNADVLAFSDIDKNRLMSYKIACEQFKKSGPKDLQLWGSLFLKMCQGEPADHFRIYLNSGEIETVAP